MVTPAHREEPPPVGRSRVDLASERAVLIVHRPDPPVAPGKHELGLLDPLVGRVVVLRHDQPALPIRITRHGIRIDSRLLTRNPRDEIDPQHAPVVGPSYERERARGDDHPCACQKPSGVSHRSIAVASDSRDAKEISRSRGLLRGQTILDSTMVGLSFSRRFMFAAPMPRRL